VLGGPPVPGVEKAQRHALQQRPAGEQGVQTGQCVPALVQCAQDIEYVRPHPGTGEVPLRLLVRVEGTRQLGPHPVRGAGLTGPERVDVQSLTERGDLGLDLGERRLVALTPAPPPQSPEPPTHPAPHGRHHALRPGRHHLKSADATDR
jgi:hypothetical protein